MKRKGKDILSYFSIKKAASIPNISEESKDVESQPLSKAISMLSLLEEEEKQGNLLTKHKFYV